MTPHILTAGGKSWPLPTTIPTVAAHVNAARNMVPRLLQQINDEKIYEFAFRGAKDWVMLDIGANIGLVSLYAHDVCKHIIALEPVLPLFAVLNSVCALFPHIQPIKLALAGHNGTATFHLNDVNTTAGSMSQTYGTVCNVETVTLSRLIGLWKLSRVDFCKVDIEGTELEALTPMEIDCCKAVIRAYYVEVHNCPNSTWEYKLGKLAEIFAHAGYRQMQIRGDAIYACIK